MKPDIADKVQAYSVTTQIESVKGLHENLLRGLERYMQKRERPLSITVLGIGAQVLPYGNNLEWFSKHFKDGKVVLRPANQEMDPIYPNSLTIQGKAVGLIRRF